MFLWIILKSLAFFIFFILMISLIDLYIYSRVCILLLMKSNLKKWNWNKNSLMKLLLMMNLSMALIF